MTRHNSAKNIGRLLGFCLIIFTVASCTKDYFKDETNFRLYVPQIKNKEITNFYVAFHDENGNQVYTRTLEAPFEQDDLMKTEGILRFKLFPGKYKISCFADFAPGTLPGGKVSYNDSYMAYSKVSGRSDLYEAPSANTRALFFEATALPIGNPACKDPVPANIDQDRCFIASVGTKFIDLPANVTRIDIYYRGIATQLRFGGAFARYTGNDVVYKSILTADHKSGNEVNFSNHYMNPSSEILLGYVNPNRGGSDDPKEISLEVEFYSGTQLLGTASYTPGSTYVIPTYSDGTTVTDLVLDPKSTINFTFKGFTIVEITLTPWGDITGGEVTPL